MDGKDYVWKAKTNRSFVARCHIEEPGNSWLRFGFDSDLGRIERPQDIRGNPKFIVSSNGKTVVLKGTVTLPRQGTEQMGEVTFAPKGNGITAWKWTLTRDGHAYSEKGRGAFKLDAPKAVRRRTPAKAKKAASTKKARRRA